MSSWLSLHELSLWSPTDTRDGGLCPRSHIRASHACMLSHFSHVQLFATPWTIAHQAPLSMGFSRQEHWSGLPCAPPGDLPYREVEPTSLASPELAGRFFTTSTTWEVTLWQLSDAKKPKKQQPTAFHVAVVWVLIMRQRTCQDWVCCRPLKR